MARTADILVAFMAAHGSRALADSAPIPYARLRNMYQSDEQCARCARFASDGAEPTGFEAWAARRSVERLGIIHPTRLLESPPRLHGKKELARSVTSELSGGSNLVFVARRSDADDVYLVTQADAPRLQLEDADVARFVESDSAAALLKAYWLEWNVRDGWPAEASWDGFAAAARGSREQRMVRDAGRVFARVGVSDETRRAWHGLVSERRAPPVLTYDFRYLVSCEPLALVSDCDAARASLARALDDAVAFAQGSTLVAWAKGFAEARRALDAPGGSGLGAQLFEGALLPEAICLLDAAWQADVFGGMGSWNDVEQPDGYEQVTRALWVAQKTALEAAINAR